MKCFAYCTARIGKGTMSTSKTWLLIEPYDARSDLLIAMTACQTLVLLRD